MPAISGPATTPASLDQLAASLQVPEAAFFQVKIEGTRLTVMPDCVPVMVPETVSVAVMDCVPAVANVTPPVKVRVPLSPLTKV